MLILHIFVFRSSPSGLATNPPVQNGNGAMSDAEEQKALNKWNPMKEDYNNKNFNQYSQGPGRNLPEDRHAPR